MIKYFLAFLILWQNLMASPFHRGMNEALCYVDSKCIGTYKADYIASELLADVNDFQEFKILINDLNAKILKINHDNLSAKKMQNLVYAINLEKSKYSFDGFNLMLKGAIFGTIVGIIISTPLNKVVKIKSLNKVEQSFYTTTFTGIGGAAIGDHFVEKDYKFSREAVTGDHHFEDALKLEH
jgi:hypothetical protein